jgi:arsenical pump membrane protein
LQNPLRLAVKALSSPSFCKGKGYYYGPMVWALLIASLSVLGMIALLIFCPSLKIGRFVFQTFYWPPLVGAVLVLSLGLVSGAEAWSALTSDSAINPLEILLLFLSMTFLSIVLDEAGFFSYLASEAVQKAHGNQKVLFIFLYLLVSLLTIFTSNDIIILTFTPFLLFFCERGKIDPIPYLIEEFVAANTWSTLLLIGNPTNIYISSAFGLTFFDYFKVMWLPTIFGGVTSFLIMELLFHKKLSLPLSGVASSEPIKDRPLLIASLLLLSSCIILLACGSYLPWGMWLTAGVSALILLLFALCYAAARHDKFSLLGESLKRLPYSIVPFLLSMFVLVLALHEQGVSSALAQFLNQGEPIYSYGFASFFFCNLINNIPMSVLFSDVLSYEGSSLRGVYASIIGSNLGAFFTPIGALAGVMWMSILHSHGLRFRFLDFFKYGSIIALPTLAAALAGLLVTL